MTTTTVGKSHTGPAASYAAGPGDQDVSEVINPATGQVTARYRNATKEDVDSAVKRAEAALEVWGATPPAERAEILLKIAAAIQEEAGEFARLESEDVGKPLTQAHDDMPLICDAMRFFAGAARVSSVPAAGEYANGSTSWVRREPLGVVGLITPWNYPLMMAVWKIAPALAAGNTILLKPATLTPSTTIKLVEVANRFLPEGVLNLILGHRETGTAMVEHPTIRKISLTGATSTGKFVAAAAAKTMKRLGLELGGKAPVLVFADSPIRETARDLVAFGFYNSGQSCTAPCRIIVEESIHDEFVEAYCAEVMSLVVGDPLDSETTMGPVISEHHMNQVLGFIEGARRSGARIRTGGSRIDRPGWFIEPTVVTNVNQTDDIVQKEVFGPVVTIQAAKDDDQMLRLANDIDFGLSASVWTTSLARTLRFSKELQFGTVWVNQHENTAAEMPFGGFGESGLGYELTAHSIDEYSQIKHVMVKPDLTC